MSKKMRIIALLLTVLIIFSFSACGDNGDRNADGITETDVYLVKDGKTDYVIVYPSETKTELITTSINELKLFFEQATGITIDAKPDNADGVVWSNTAKYISLGDTKTLISMSY